MLAVTIVNGPATNFPALDLPDIYLASRKSESGCGTTGPEVSLLSLQSDNSSEDIEETIYTPESLPDVHSTMASSDPTVQAVGPEDISCVLANLCASFNLKVISCPYKFSQDAEWVNKGPDLSAGSFIDICLNSSLSTDLLSRYWKYRHVSHDTVRLITHLKVSPEYPSMQQT